MPSAFIPSLPFASLERLFRYGIANVHLLRSAQYGPSSIRLNVTADEPILSALHPSSYNYTGLLTGSSFASRAALPSTVFSSSRALSSEDRR